MNLKWGWLVVVLLFSTALSAAKMDSINVGRVAVADQSLATQTTAGRAALRQVFIKMSGATDSVKHPSIRRAITNYEQYMISSTFVQREQQLWIEARFNQERIRDLLKSTGQPVWSNLRPTASMWIAVKDSENDIKWIHQNNAENFGNALSDAAFERGVSVILPLGDLNDAKAVSSFDVWSQNLNKISAQSVRYNTDFVISATLKPITDDGRLIYLQNAAFSEQQKALESLLNAERQANRNQEDMKLEPQIKNVRAVVVPKETDQYQVDWIISNGRSIKIGKVFLEQQSLVAKTLIDIYANQLSAQYAVGGAGTDENVSAKSILILHNLKNLSDHHNAQSLIDAIPQVSGLSLELIEGNKATFSLSLTGQIDEFIALIVLDPRVSAFLDAPEAADANTIQLIWEP